MRNAFAWVGAVTLTGMLLLTTAPAQAQATQPAQNVIVILPFAAASGGDDAWIGKAVQQDLYADLTQGTILRVLAPGSISAAGDQGAALGKAREVGASFVVFGQIQTAGKEVRLSGQVLAVVDGKPLGSIKATGPVDDLFHLEDALAGQLLIVLPRNLLNAQAFEGPQAATGRPGQQAPPQPAAPANPSSQWPSGPYAAPGLHETTIFGASSRPATAEP